MLLLFLRASKKRKIGIILLIVLLISTSLIYNIQSAKAGAPTSVSNKITNSTPGATSVQYVTTFTFPGVTHIECINLAITTTTATPSAVPTGLVTTSASKLSISGGGLTAENWTLNNTVNGVLQYENDTGENTTASELVITTNGITNPTSSGVYYMQIRTYSGLDGSNCSGQSDNITITYAITAGQALSVAVDPSLTFSIAGVASAQAVNGATTNAATVTGTNIISMLNVNTSTNSIAAQDLTVSTNATNGYTVYASYSGTLTSTGGDTIADHSGDNVTPSSFPAAGVSSAFGYTTNDTNLSRFQTNNWAKFETWGYPVATASDKVSSDTNRIGYQVSVDGVQAAGSYTTTIILVATPTY